MTNRLLDIQSLEVAYGHEAVGDNRSSDPTAVVTHGVGPDDAQIIDIAAIDFRQRTEAIDIVSAAIAQPVTGLGIVQALIGN